MLYVCGLLLPFLLNIYPFSLPHLGILLYLFSLPQPWVFLNQKSFQKQCDNIYYRLKYSSPNLVRKIELRRKERFQLYIKPCLVRSSFIKHFQT